MSTCSVISSPPNLKSRAFQPARAPFFGWTVAAALAFAAVFVGAAGAARADNDPEKAQRRAEDDIVPKVALACGVPLSMAYDGASLRAHNKDIAQDQTDGENECNEPLRYLWAACKSETGKAAVKRARISKVVCKGMAGAAGSLSLSAGTITVGRALEEKDPFVRSRKTFESLLNVSLTLQTDDPYQDETWHALASQPNPVTSTSSYCLVNGQKVAFDQYVYDPFTRRKEDAKVKCWKDGDVVIDLVISKGIKTGFLTNVNGQNVRREAYRSDKRHGEQKTTENGVLTSLAQYDGGERVWMKEFRPNGKLLRYSRTVASGGGGGGGAIAFRENGTVYTLDCVPGLRDDKELRAWCGFDGAKTTPIYDGTGKVARIVTWKDGVLQKEGAGDSAYAARSDVGFKDGKKNGPERVLRADGTLESVISWDRGVKDGKELAYGDDGKKVIKEVVWKAGEVKTSTELYLNGNPKQKEIYDGRDKKRVTTFWDTGKMSTDGLLAICGERGYFDELQWCEEGVHKTWFESGAPEAEASYVHGKRQGQARSWFENGKPASVEDYIDGKLTKAKRWDKDGKVVADEEYEADGSRKIRR